MREMGGGYPFELTEEPTGYREGSVGWGGFQTWVVPRTGSDGTLWRATFVLHLEHGDGKIVQAHSAMPVTNESNGFQLTTSVDEIAESVSIARPDLSSASAPDGTVTIAFTDIEDSTLLNDFLGDQRWLEILRAHNDVVKGVATEQGGTIVKGQGDGFMLAFPSARRALRCADSIERAVEERFNDPGSMIRVRIGIHVGESYARRTTSSATR
jgi:GGDEF domain-containing protein